MSLNIKNTYYYITDKGTIGKAIWLNGRCDRYRLISGNVFKSYSEIKNVIEQINIKIRKGDKV